MMPLEHRKSLTETTTIPPPPQYKGVHFAPQVEERRNSVEDSIPVEGLPTRPAMPKQSQVLSPGHPLGPNLGQNLAPPVGETIAIQVRKTNPVPLLTSVTAVTKNAQSSFEQPVIEKIKKQPPVPPPKTSTLSSASSNSNRGIKGVRDKALAASAAGCEIVFVSPDEGFNEEVVVTSMTSESEAAAKSK